MNYLVVSFHRYLSTWFPHCLHDAMLPDKSEGRIHWNDVKLKLIPMQNKRLKPTFGCGYPLALRWKFKNRGIKLIRYHGSKVEQLVSSITSMLIIVHHHPPQINSEGFFVFNSFLVHRKLSQFRTQSQTFLLLHNI